MRVLDSLRRPTASDSHREAQTIPTLTHPRLHAPPRRAAFACALISVVALGCAAGSRRPHEGRRDADLVDADLIDAGLMDARADVGVPDSDASIARPDAEPPGPDAGARDADPPTPDADVGPSPSAPTVRGEANAGRHPSWSWTVPPMAASFRYRVDGGAWTSLSLATPYVTLTAGLGEGSHLFEVQAGAAAGAWSASGEFTTTVAHFARAGFWDGVERDLATTPYGRVCAVSAHNAYQGALGSPAANLAETLSRVEAAQAAGADLIELDIKVQDGILRVSHEDTGGGDGALLADVLDSPSLQAGDQIVFLEIKESAPTAAFIVELLRLLRDRPRLVRNGRPIVLRAFHQFRQNLTLLRAELQRPENLFLRAYVRTSMLYSGNQVLDVGDYQDLISEARDAGHQMVEFHYQDLNLAAKLSWARSLGLGINLWTMPVSAGEVFVASLRDEADVLTTDYSVSRTRAIIEEANGLFHLDAAERRGGASVTSIGYQRGDATTYELAVNGSEQPSLSEGGHGSALYGGYLSFDPGRRQSGVLYDADVRAGHGVLLSVVAKFDTLSLADGATMSLLAKTEGGAWGLELHNAAGGGGTVLRFGVRVGGSYYYASINAGRLNTSDDYLLTGAYDGNGAVRLWVDNSARDVVDSSASGGIVNNDVSVRIGADPVGASGAGFHFDGRLQRVLAQTWGPH